MTWHQWTGMTLPFVLLLGIVLRAESQEASKQASSPVNLIVAVEGKVLIKHTTWARYEPLVFGADIRQGDLLQVEEASRAKVLCSDLTLHVLTTGADGIPCGQDQVVLQRSNGTLSRLTRSGPQNGAYPIVLSPRKTKILSPHPVLRWTGANGATRYALVLRGPSLNWYSEASLPNNGLAGDQLLQSTPVFQVAYPENAPTLTEGADFKFIVVANGHSSDSEGGLGLGFSMIDLDSRKAVERAQKQIEDLGLPEGPTQFLIAYLYMTYDLNAEAIERLEAISPNFNVDAVARLLGDLYLRVGLPHDAEAAYLSSLKLSKEQNDPEGQMLSEWGLSSVYCCALGKSQLAIQHLDAIIDIAHELGDTRTADLANQRLKTLK